jgi:hypothetical protein
LTPRQCLNRTNLEKSSNSAAIAASAVSLGGMKTVPVDWRARILAAYDAGDATREMVAARFRVSLGMVKKLLQQGSVLRVQQKGGSW